MSRVVQAMEALGWDQSMLAEQLDAPKSTMTAWFKIGDEGNWPAAKYILRMPATLQVEDRWLLSGEGPMKRSPAPTQGREGELLQQFRQFLETMEERFGSTQPATDQEQEEKDQRRAQARAALNAQETLSDALLARRQKQQGSARSARDRRRT